MRSIAFSAVALVLCAHSAGAQTGPTLGYVIDAAQKAIRPIRGIAGSASYGGPLDLGIEVASAAIAETRRTAVLANGDGVFVLSDAPGGPGVTQVSGLAGSPDMLSIAPAGIFGAAYYAQTQTLAVIGPIGAGAPEVHTTQLAAVQGVPVALAISGDGLSAALVVPTRARTAAEAPARGSGVRAAYALPASVVLLDARSGEIRQIAAVASTSSVTFLPAGDAIVVADPSAGAVFVVRDITGTPARTDLLSGDDGLPAPSSVAVLADAKTVLAAGADGSLAVLSLTGADPVFLHCACAPASLRRLDGAAVLVSDVRDGVAWMLDWSAANARVLFIPPADQDR